jgi:hypothetical protein
VIPSLFILLYKGKVHIWNTQHLFNTFLVSQISSLIHKWFTKTNFIFDIKYTPYENNKFKKTDIKFNNRRKDVITFRIFEQVLIDHLRTDVCYLLKTSMLFVYASIWMMFQQEWENICWIVV